MSLSRSSLLKQIVLIGNYLPDAQHSMLRYEHLLVQGLINHGLVTHVLRPSALFGGRLVHSKIERLGRFFDKFVCFPLVLRRQFSCLKSKGNLVVHLLDQGNGVYCDSIRGLPLLATCHDLLAIKEKLGYFATYSSGSVSRYQSWNRAALNRVSWFACVSEATRNDCISLLGAKPEQSVVIHNPLDPFFAVPASDRCSSLPQHYLLNVGNSGWYKNRLGALRIYAALRALGYKHALVLMGGSLSYQECELIKQLGIKPHVQYVAAPDDATVRSAYAHAEALLFPSITEGFGWPILEAQAQNCLVFTTEAAPMTETGGSGAVYIDPSQPEAAAQILWQHLSHSPDAQRLASAKARAQTFTVDRCVESYLQLYQSVLDQHLNGIVPASL